MARSEGTRATALPMPLGRFAHAVLLLNVGVVVIAGFSLFVLSSNTDESFAWTIKAPITAAFLGAGYWSSLLSILLALRIGEWRTARIAIVPGLVLTGFTTLPTLWYLEEFHLDEGPFTARAVAWIWLVLYVTEPWLLLAVLVHGERAGGRFEYRIEQPLLPWVRGVVLAHAVALTLLALLLWPLGVDGFWPWPLPPLAAGAVAGWLLTFAAACWWCLREGDWRRSRILFPSFIAYLLLQLVVVLRYTDALAGDAWQTWAYLGTVALSLTLLGLATLQQERVPAAPR